MNPNINIRLPLNLELELLKDKAELIRMAMMMHSIKIDLLLDKLDRDIRELRELLKDV